MKKSIKYIPIVFLFLLLTSCISGVEIDKKSKAYQYNAEKYGLIEVSYSDEISEMPERVKIFKKLKLNKKIINSLKSYKLFDQGSPNIIKVEIDKFRLRSALNAGLFGSKVGFDLLEGGVTLLSANRKKIASFRVSGSQKRGGIIHANTSYRLNRMGNQFGELTSKTILGHFK